MELNDLVQITLTQAGAEVLNKYYHDINVRCKAKLNENYSEGDIAKHELWMFFSIFGKSLYCGAPVYFRNLEKA